MEFLARPNNKYGKSQTVAEHLENVRKLAGCFAKAFGSEREGQFIGLLHDLGKFSPEFQEVLAHKREHVNHTAAGAAVLINLLYRQKQNKFPLLALIVAAHHSELDCSGIRSLSVRMLTGKGEKTDSGNNSLALFGSEKLKQALKNVPHFNELHKLCPPLYSKLDKKYPNIALMLHTRFLFSCLVDADYSDAAMHENPRYLDETSSGELNKEKLLDALLQKHEELRNSSTAPKELNRLRDELFDNCLSMGSSSPSGLFSLTAPTGLGKTLALLAFALSHANANDMRRIIIVLPYLSIIEQNAAVYREISPNILESHSNTKYSDENRLLSERWEAPIIITTSVKFFETLFASKATDCRILHQIADSVIVFDEAQSLPQNLLQPTLQAVSTLCDEYACSFVFSTATQPSYDYLKNISWNPTEIVKSCNSMYQKTRRVKVDWQINEPIPLESIADEMEKFNQCCCILNLKKHCRALYDALSKRVEPDSVFYITTELCSANRTDILREIKNRLENDLPCHLIASQCVEAGVDFSFPVLYRALAPLEAIIQAAGRCNRNGITQDGRVTIFIPKFEGRLYPDDSYAYAASCVKILANRHEIDIYNHEHAEEYYKMLYDDFSGDKKELINAIESLDFPLVAKKYKLIDKTEFNIIVPYENKKELYNKIRNEAVSGGLTRRLMAEAREIVVSAYEVDTDKCELLSFAIGKGKASYDKSNWYLVDDYKCYNVRTGLHFTKELTDLIL